MSASSPDSCTLRVASTCSTPTSVPDPDLTLPLEQRTPGGLGIHLMRNVMDRLQYRHEAGHNTLRLEKVR